MGDGEFGQIGKEMTASSKTMRGTGMELPQACQNLRVSCGEGEKPQNSCSNTSNSGVGRNSSSDTKCPSCVNQSIFRICAFEDPMAPADLNDPNPDSMPSHLLSPPPPDQQTGDQANSATSSATSDVTKWMDDTGIMVPGIGLGASMISQTASTCGGILNMALELTGISYINYVSNNVTAFGSRHC